MALDELRVRFLDLGAEVDFRKAILGFKATHPDVDSGMLWMLFLHFVCDGARIRFDGDGVAARHLIEGMVASWPGWTPRPEPESGPKPS